MWRQCAYNSHMRPLMKSRSKPGREPALLLTTAVQVIMATYDLLFGGLLSRRGGIASGQADDLPLVIARAYQAHFLIAIPAT